MGPHRPLRSILYYTNWSIYARSHTPESLPCPLLTHILYAFATLSSSTGTVTLTDPWSDTDQHYPTDSWNDPGTSNVYGCIKQLFLLKKRFRAVRVLLSVGGWTYSPQFRGAATQTAAGRREFARSVVRIVEDCGFDGVDVDWEYPQNGAEAADYVALLAEVRAELDRAQQKRGGRVRFELSVACPAGREQYQVLKIREMDCFLDFWNLMAYDYAGSWGQKAGHQANLFPCSERPDTTPFDTDSALRFYCGEGGVRTDKMVLGMPLYGRAFENTAGPGEGFQGVGEGSWDKGVWDFKVLPKEGAVEHHDCEGIVASWSYDAKTKTMVSYDSKRIATAKGTFAKRMGLGGGMWWESSADRNGEESLVKAFVDAVGGKGALDRSSNCLEYPESKYENLRKGFPGEGEC